MAANNCKIRCQLSTAVMGGGLKTTSLYIKLIMYVDIVIKDPRSSRNISISVFLIILFCSLFIFTCWYSYYFITTGNSGGGNARGFVYIIIGFPVLAFVSFISSIKRLFSKRRYFSFNNTTVSFCLDAKRVEMDFAFYDNGFGGNLNWIYDKLSDNDIYAKELKYKDINALIFEKENLIFDLNNPRNYKIKINLRGIDRRKIDNIKNIMLKEGITVKV